MNELAKGISIKWKAMSPDEQKAAVEPLLEELKAAKKANSAPVRNSAISAFHDNRATLSTVKTEVSLLRPFIFTRSVLTVFVAAAHSRSCQYGVPAD